jgi:carbamoyltransferase
MLYSTFTAYLGFKVNEDEYKVMGLAAYGKPTLVEEVRRLIRRTPDGAFALDLNYFEFHTTAERSYSSHFIELFGPPRNPYEPIDFDTAEGQRFADCAASVQRVLEDILVELAKALHEETGLADLCLGGGVALNGVANARLLAESGFERVFVPPAPGDAGCAIGAALYCDRIHFGNPDRDLPDHPFWGPSVDGSELARLAQEDGHTAAEFQDGVLIDHIADDLSAGRIVGWMEGALEFGPRALGHRSILAAPHTIEMRDRLNREIKYREPFRPFAPVVPIEVATRYFEIPPGGTRLARFMSGVFPVRREWRSRLQAITHIDGTARLQVLEPTMAPRLHALLEAYGRRSGIPVLLNTSFNLAGEPIVNRAVEGYSTFLRCKIDVLVAGGTRVMKRTSTMTKTQVEEEVA